MGEKIKDGKVLRGLLLFLTKLSALCFALALAINFANVVGRYVFHMPIFWAEEVTIILIIWSVSLISFQLTVNNEHLVTEILKPYLSFRMQKALLVFTTLIGVAISVFIAYYSYLVVELVGRLGQVTTVAEIPKSVAYASITVMFVFAGVGGLIRLFDVIKHSNSGSQK